MSFIPKPFEIYKHFKGNLYQIIAIAEHSETGEKLVVYQALYEGYKIYARPLSMFTSMVDKEKYPDVKQKMRFERYRTPADGESEGCEFTETIIQESKEKQPEQDECHLDPLVIEFLDADNYEQRLNVLAALHHRITDEMLTTMAISCDVELSDGSTQERYEALKNCLMTLEKYECNRLR